VPGRTSQPQVVQRLSRHPVQQRRQQRPVGRFESDPLPVEVALQHGELVPQRQDFRVLVAIAARQPQQREHVRDTQVSQSKEHETASSRGRPAIDKGCCLEQVKIGQVIRKGP
jgi:hypothetical protein